MEEEARETEEQQNAERLEGDGAPAHAALAQGRAELLGDRRFLSREMVVWLGAYLLFAFTFASLRVNNDGLVYYSFLRRFVGEKVDSAYAYQFGSALFDLPFYLGAKAIRSITGSHAVLGAPITEASVAVASAVALLAALYLGWRLLDDLELPATPAVLMLAVFGSPLFYYTVFEPSYKHAVDALLAVVFTSLLLRLSREPTRNVELALAVCLALQISVRYVNFVLAV